MGNSSDAELGEKINFIKKDGGPAVALGVRETGGNIF